LRLLCPGGLIGDGRYPVARPSAIICDLVCWLVGREVERFWIWEAGCGGA